MPKLVEMLPDTVESVVRPVILDITRELFKITGISEKTNILYPGESEATFQPGSALGAVSTEPHLVGDPRLSIRVDEEFDQTQALAQAVYQPENLYVWKDDRISTYIKPSYAHVNFTINFEYRAEDKTRALRWRDEMKTRVSMMRDLYLHAVKYHFVLPEVFVQILKDLHAMREAVAPYGDTWEQYFQACASNRVSQISTFSGDRQLWAVSETQKRVQGRFSFEDAPERGEKNAEGETWNISFQYKFELEKPIAAVLAYPLVVHNQVVPANRRPSREDQPQRWEDTQSSRSLSSSGYAGFEAGRWQDSRRQATYPGRSVPDYDEFLPSSIPDNSLRLFTALTTIDLDPAGDPALLLDLNQVSRNWHLDSGVLAYMAKIHQMLNVPGRCPFIVSLYEDSKLLSGYNVRVDEQLRVYATRPLQLRSVYHVRLGLNTAWCRLPLESLEPLQEDAATLLKLMTAIDSRATLGKLLSTGRVPKQSLLEAMQLMCQAERAAGNGQEYPYSLVQSLFVVAYRKDQ